MPDTNRTDTDALAELLRERDATETEWWTPGTDPAPIINRILPPGWTHRSEDMERHAPEPRRPRGTSKVHDAASLVAAVQRRRLGGVEPVVYADEDNRALVAVLNDDEADRAAWRDYRVELDLRRTPEWLHWTKLDGKVVAQETFAEHIEDGVTELREPDPATMLELAQSFHVTVNARAKAGSRLADGRVQFVYEEDAQASAGEGGTITIPEVLLLVVRPFIGSPAFEVRARFRYRLPRGGGDLALGYKLDRPHDVERSAFRDVVKEVGEQLPTAAVINGPAPRRTGGIVDD